MRPILRSLSTDAAKKNSSPGVNFNSSGLLQFALVRHHLQLVPTLIQAVRNSAVCMATGVRRHEHITPVLRQLHWLPVRQRVESHWLYWYSKRYTAAHHLIWQRTANSLPLLTAVSSDHPQSTHVRPSRQTPVLAIVSLLPRLWNILPVHLQQPDLSLGQFLRALKTHLFAATLLDA